MGKKATKHRKEPTLEKLHKKAPDAAKHIARVEKYPLNEPIEIIAIPSHWGINDTLTKKLKGTPPLYSIHDKH